MRRVNPARRFFDGIVPSTIGVWREKRADVRERDENMIDEFFSLARRTAGRDEPSSGADISELYFFRTVLSPTALGLIIGSVQLACLNCGANRNASADSQTTINGYHLSN